MDWLLDHAALGSRGYAVPGWGGDRPDDTERQQGE